MRSTTVSGPLSGSSTVASTSITPTYSAWAPGQYTAFWPALRRTLAVLAELLGAAMLGWLAWLGFNYVATFGGDLTPYLALPKGLFTSALWIGSAVVALAFAVAAWRERRGRW